MAQKVPGTMVLYVLVTILLLLGATSASMTVQVAKYHIAVAEMTIQLTNLWLKNGSSSVRPGDLNDKLATATAALDTVNGLAQRYNDNGQNVTAHKAEKIRQLQESIASLPALSKLDPFLGEILDKYTHWLQGMQRFSEKLDQLEQILKESEPRNATLEAQFQEDSARLQKVQDRTVEFYKALDSWSGSNMMDNATKGALVGAMKAVDSAILENMPEFAYSGNTTAKPAPHWLFYYYMAILVLFVMCMSCMLCWLSSDGGKPLPSYREAHRNYQEEAKEAKEAEQDGHSVRTDGTSDYGSLRSWSTMGSTRSKSTLSTSQVSGGSSVKGGSRRSRTSSAASSAPSTAKM